MTTALRALGAHAVSAYVRNREDTKPSREQAAKIVSRIMKTHLKQSQLAEQEICRRLIVNHWLVS